jgi:hypothetical protein
MLGVSMRDEGAPGRADGVRLLALATGAFFFLVYARRASQSLVLDGDSAELVTAAIVWGVPHAPGYPLFTAIGHLVALLGSSDPALATGRVHLTSAFFHAGAVAATVGTVYQMTRNRIAAAVAGCALGLGRSFFLGSLYAEVFPLNDLFVALLFLLAMEVRERKRSPVLFAACVGMASAHHMMIALAFPGLAILVCRPLADLVRKEPRRLATLGFAAIVPFLACYALVPLAAARDPALSWGDVHDVRSLVALMTRHDYGGLLSPVHGGGHGTAEARVLAYGVLLYTSFGVVPLGAALIGALRLGRRDSSVASALLVTFLLAGPLFAAVNAVDISSEEGLAFFERFATMSAVPVAFFVGTFVDAGLSLPVRPSAKVLGGAALAIGWLSPALVHARLLDRSHDDRGADFAHDLVFGAPDGALLLLSGDVPTSAALYVCAVERACGRRTTVSPGGLALRWAMAQFRRRNPGIPVPWSSGPALKRTHELAAAQPAGRMIFAYPDLLEKDPLLRQTFDVLPDHLLFRLWPLATNPALEREAFIAAAADMTGGGCRGCDLAEPPDHPSQEMQLVHAYEAAAINRARFASEPSR